MRWLGGVAGAGLLIGCLEANIPEVVTGNWGGDHFGMVASTSGAELEYDCAEGRILEPIRPNAMGRFSVSGEHYPGHGGPIRIEEEQVRRPAHYDGTVKGGRMSLLVTLTDTDERLGPFTLSYGRSPFVFKCL